MRLTNFINVSDISYLAIKIFSIYIFIKSKLQAHILSMNEQIICFQKPTILMTLRLNDRKCWTGKKILQSFNLITYY